MLYAEPHAEYTLSSLCTFRVKVSTGHYTAKDPTDSGRCASG